MSQRNYVGKLIREMSAIDALELASNSELLRSVMADNDRQIAELKAAEAAVKVAKDEREQVDADKATLREREIAAQTLSNALATQKDQQDARQAELDQVAAQQAAERTALETLSAEITDARHQLNSDRAAALLAIKNFGASA